MNENYTKVLAKKIKEAKETNNLERENYLKGLCRFLSIVKNFYKILEYYEEKNIPKNIKNLKIYFGFLVIYLKFLIII